MLITAETPSPARVRVSKLRQPSVPPRPILDEAQLRVPPAMVRLIFRAAETREGARLFQNRGEPGYFDLATHVALGHHIPGCIEWLRKANSCPPPIVLNMGTFIAQQAKLVVWLDDIYLASQLKWLFDLPRHLRAKQVEWMMDSAHEVPPYLTAGIDDPLVLAQEAAIIGPHLFARPLVDQRARALAAIVYTHNGCAEIFALTHQVVDTGAVVERAKNRWCRRHHKYV